MTHTVALHYAPTMTNSLAPARRLRACVEAWPEAETGTYDSRCCRFPKSCSATIYDETAVPDDDLEPAAPAPDLLVLTLPTEPPRAVAVVGTRSGARWVPTSVNGGRWQDTATGQIRTWVGVLEREHSVYVIEREPRVWEPIEPAPVGEPNGLRRIEVGGEVPGEGELYTYDPDALDWVSDRGVHRTWGELREVRVREVLP